MLVIAHRGANNEALENTWTAFEKAIDGGANRIEFDIKLTADDHAIVLHDKTLQRTGNSAEPVAKLTRAQVENRTLKNGEPIPFLDEVIDRLHGRVGLNIEIKDNSVRAAEVVAKILHTKNSFKGIIVSSFFPKPLCLLSDQFPKIELACLWGDTVSWPNISHFAPPVFMAESRAKIWHPWVGYVNADSMDYARAKGWQVYGYCELKGEEKDREKLWSRLKALEIDGLCTNYPRELVAWLEKVEKESARYYKPIQELDN